MRLDGPDSPLGSPQIPRVLNIFNGLCGFSRAFDSFLHAGYLLHAKHQ